MKAKSLRTPIGLAIAMLAMLPTIAQNEQADPHAHDWMKEQVKPKLGAEPAATGQVNTQTNTTQSPAVDTLNQSLGGVDSSYHGQHQWYKDDQVGLVAVTAAAVLVVLFVALFAVRTKKKD